MYEKENNKRIKYFIYARKSSEGEDRQMNSVEDQIDILKKRALKNNLEIVDILEESASAKKPGRKVFNEMMVRIDRGEANGILCWKLNRLARNPIDGGNISWHIQNSVIERISTPEREYYPADNVLMMQMEFGMSNQFIIDLRKDSMRGTLSKAESGWLPSRAPLGYINVGDIQGEKYIDPDEDRFDLVRAMWDMALDGVQLSKIVNTARSEWGLKNRRFRKSGGELVSKTQIYTMFSNIFYTGDFMYIGKKYRGKHKPMITLEEFEKVQIILKRKNKARPSKHNYAYSGLIKCGCGCNSMLTAYTKKNKYIYYKPSGNVKDAQKCTNSQISEIKLEKQLIGELNNTNINQKFLDWAFKQIDSNVETELRKKEKIKLNKVKAIEDKKDELNRIKIMMQKGFYDSDEEFLKAKADTIREIEVLEKQQDIEDSILNKASHLKDSFKFLSEVKNRLKNSKDTEEKHNILYSIGADHTYNKTGLYITLEDYFEPVRLEYKKLENRYNKVELDKTLTKQGKNKAFDLVCSDWGSWIDEFRMLDWEEIAFELSIFNKDNRYLFNIDIE